MRQNYKPQLSVELKACTASTESVGMGMNFSTHAFFIYLDMFCQEKNVSAYHLKIAKPAPPVCPEQNRLWKVVEKVPRTFFFQKLNIHFQAKVSFSVFFGKKLDTLKFRVSPPPGY